MTPKNRDEEKQFAKTTSREWQIHHLQMQRKKRKKAIADGV